jgi:hypothetical protein
MATHGFGRVFTCTDSWLRKSPLPSFKQALKARDHKSQVVELFTLTFLRLFRVNIMGVQKDCIELIFYLKLSLLKH